MCDGIKFYGIGPKLGFGFQFYSQDNNFALKTTPGVDPIKLFTTVIYGFS